MFGGRLVARALKSAGVRNVFGLCGDHITAILDGLADEGMRVIDTRDERSAGFMAEGWSLATGTPGVALVTGGPGLTNAVTPMADALLAGTPFVVLTSRLKLADAGKGFTQDMDQMSFVKPLTVWSRTIFDASRIGADVAEAFAQARARRGPVLLEIPVDVQFADPGDVEMPPVVEPASPVPDLAVLDAAAKLLGEAERPVAIAGEGAFWSGASGALQRFAEAGHIPVFTVRAGRGLLPDSHELAFGQPNFLRGAGRVALSQADVLLVAGAELDIVLAFGMLAPAAKLIRVERDPARVVRSRRPDVAVVAGEAAALDTLADRVRGRNGKAWIADLHAAADELDRVREPERTAPGSPVHPARIASEVSRAVGTRGTIALDAGELALWAIEDVPATGPGRLITSFATPLATMGPGIPFAMAAKLARPDEPSIALVGDGAFGFSAVELDTAARHNIPITVVIGNDASWGIVKRQMEIGYGRTVATDLTMRRYDEVGRALGARGVHADDGDALAKALHEAVSGDEPFVIDVPLSREPVHPATQMIAAMFAPPKRD